MGVTLCYRTVEAVPPEVAAAIRSEVSAACAGARWIHLEPIRFRDDEVDGRLSGGCKLNLEPHPDDYADAIGRPAATPDPDRLVSALCDWSARHGVSWDLDIDGSSIGRIAGGTDADDVRGKLEAMAAVADELAGFAPIGDDASADADPLYGDDEPPDDQGFHPHLFGPNG